MSKLLWIAVILLIGYFGIRFSNYYREINREIDERNKPSEPAAPSRDPGMPDALEPLLADAQKKGAKAMKKWLDQYRHLVKEPRLSEIELDYVMLLGRINPPEARRVFARIRARNGASSPLADRIEKLAKTYE